MTETVQTPTYTLQPGEKAAKVMAYTTNALYWGEVVVKELIRVSTWLRTNSAPDWVPLHNARVMQTMVANPPRPEQFNTLHIAASQIQAFHLIPPAQDPVDYDATEPNRRMLPVTILIGTFRVEGHIRVATQTTLGKYLEVTRENFTSIYDAKITNMLIPAYKSLTVPYILVRQELVMFAE